LLFEVEPDPVYTPEGVMVSGVWSEVLARARKEFNAQKERLDARTGAAMRPIATRSQAVLAGFIGRDAGVAARYADLTILLRPGGARQEDLRTRMFEGALFGSGRPVLLIPPSWKGAIGGNIIVAWNGKREAARALGDAGPFIERAQKVTVVSVGSGEHRSAAQAMAGDAAEHLARAGVKADSRAVEGARRTEAQALLAEAAALGADLVVMGGYGRSRLGEYIFGGVTQEAVKSASLPLFMSH
jgi:nucleotide-binding universal stress UspA family protein